MQTKRYSSYAEIEYDLKIIQLEREIHYQKIKLHLEKTKDNLRLINLMEGYFRFSIENSSSVFVRIVKAIVAVLAKLLANEKQEENPPKTETSTTQPEEQKQTENPVSE